MIWLIRFAGTLRWRASSVGVTDARIATGMAAAGTGLVEFPAMSHPAPIDFWFSIGSLYTFLSALRLDRVEDEGEVVFRWRPFRVRTIMQEMDNVPAAKPKKLAYAFRDVERRAAMYGFAFEGRPPYPLKDSDLANRVALVGAQGGWCADYVRATYRRWFVDKQEAGAEPNLSDSLREAGQDPQRVLTLAQSPEIERAYQAATDEACALGIFGVPTFAVGGELFWGDDRLDDAVTWSKAGTLGAPRPP
jgi:2-hydroxychromene-2-carboxylate isomerase